MEEYDCIIIGSGIAGLSAAAFTARAKLKTLVIGIPEKSLLHYAKEVGNYIGSDGQSGEQILDAGMDQIKKYGAEFIEGEVIDVKKRDLFLVKTQDNKIFSSKTVIIATGASLKSPGIKNEEKFLGKGVHSCVACDGYPYKNKKVAVIGNTNHAAEEAIELLAFTKDITIITHGKEANFSKELMDECTKNGIKFTNERVGEFVGDDLLKSLITKDGKEIKFDGVFVALGSVNSNVLAQKLALDSTPDGFLVIDRDGKTAIDGCFAAGGCTGGNQQIAKSAGDGCNAAISAIKKIRGLGDYSDQT